MEPGLGYWRWKGTDGWQVDNKVPETKTSPMCILSGFCLAQDMPQKLV